MALELLRKKMDLWPSLKALFRRDDSPSEIEKALSVAIEEAIGELAENEAGELHDLCASHWEEVLPRIESEIGVDPPGLDGGVIDREGARRYFVKRMARAARQSVAKLKLRGLLQMQLDARRRGMQRFVMGTLLALSVGGVLGALALHPYSWLSISFAIVLGALGVVQSQRSGVELVKWFGERVSRSRETFSELLSREYREGVREFFREYAGLFAVVRRELLQSQSEIKPRQKEWKDLFLELKAIEQEL